MLEFRTKAAANDFHARLLIAADRGERFDPASKLPESMSPHAAPKGPVTSYQAAFTFMAHKWVHWAATSRRSAVETLTTGCETLVSPGSSPTPHLRTLIRRWLREVVLIHPFDDFGTVADKCRDDDDLQAHRWLTEHSLPLTDLDVARAEAVLDAFTRRRDGTGLTAPTVISRKRTQFGGFLKYCVRQRWLPTNPLAESDWKSPLVDKEVNPELLLSPDDAHVLLEALPAAGRLGPRLVVFFATLFYAGLRPSEALALTPNDLHLPDSGWGQIIVRRAVTNTGSRYTDDGQPHQERPLKWRSRTTIRQVPIPPQLVEHLQQHLQAYSAAADGSLFTNMAGNRLDHAPYLHTFNQAKQLAFEPHSPLRRVTPYSLRHANATILLNAGVPVADAARRLGHSPDVLLAIYAGVMTTDEAASNRRIDSLLAKRKPLSPHAHEDPKR